MNATTLPAFTLTDTGGVARAFPSGRPALLCFVHEECATCDLSLPLIEAAQRAFGHAVDVWAIGQDAEGNAVLAARHNLTLPLLDDSALGVSFAYDLDTVPTIILTDPAGAEQRRFIGFDRASWQTLWSDLAVLAEGDSLANAGSTVTQSEPAPNRQSSIINHQSIDWPSYPELRPGCGSKSVEPGIAERLAAEASGSPLRARRIEIAEADDPFEFLFDQGLTDGLPVIPPTPERVLRMLAGTRRDPQSVVAVVPPNMAPVTVEKVAINAVMAGCRPEYLPVVLAAVEAICTDQFNIHGVLATTFFVGPVLIVNGPIRRRIGLNSGINALGQGHRANATIGRAVQLVVRNVGGGRPGEVDRAVLGQPGKLGFCFAEDEERSNWELLHVERGYRPEESTVTVFAGCAPNGITDQLSRDAASLATSYGMALAAAGHPKLYNSGEIVVVVPPEHVATFAVDRWSKAQVRAQIQRTGARPARDLVRGAGGSGEGLPEVVAARLGADTLVPKFAQDDFITLVVAGGPAGKFAAYLAGWAAGPSGSRMVTRPIEEP